MTDRLQWKEPLSVVRWEYQHEVAPQFKEVFWLCVKWSLIIGLPVLYATWRWLPEGFYRMLGGVLISALLLPLGGISQAWLGSKWRARCFLSKRGAARVTIGGSRAYGWKQVEAYRFEDDLRVAGVRRLALKVRVGKRRIVRYLGFSPGEVNERQMDDLLRRYLPSRPWESP